MDAGHTREGQNEDFSLGFELGAHMREAVNINLGLLALKKCIEGTPVDLFLWINCDCAKIIFDGSFVSSIILIDYSLFHFSQP